MARKFPIRHPNKPGAGKLPPRTIKGGSKRPRRTGLGAKGMGLGYHGKPRGATTMAKGAGYHGKGPKSNRARGISPMVKNVGKPAAHKAGTKRHPGK